MQKKVLIDDIRVGMRVIELDISWLKSPFWRRAFTIKNEKDIQQIKQYCKYIVIDLNESDLAATNHLRQQYSDTAKESVELRVQRKLPGDSSYSAKGRDDSEQSADAGASEQLSKQASLDGGRVPVEAADTPARQRLKKAEKDFDQTVHHMTDIFSDIRVGRAVDSPKLRQSVTTLAQDVMGDSSSLLLLTRLKEKEQTLAEKSVNVCILTLTFAKHLGIRKDQLHELGLGALLHDIGMLRVPDNILAQQGPLNPSQRAIVEQHVMDGVSFVAMNDELSPMEGLKNMIACHHERYDGSGYPVGIKGKAIPLFARILGITTTYEAMTRERFYSPTSSPTQALAKLYRWRYTLFDGRLVEKFIQALGVYPPGCLVELDSGQVAVVTAINPDQRTRPVIRVLLAQDQTALTDQPELDLMMPELAHIHILRTLDTRDLELPTV